ncbi:MAG: FAD-binding oxidoreductase [Candidatus Electryonea clarkiae]|nr:FAD-binding oxidoreductase [Candidatus Electryonea clarkiae]MDP8287945.1 FAD-binding oxidoreductase [Candidatus Electryonea clarkiae]
MDFSAANLERLKQYFDQIWLDEAAYPAILPKTMEDVMSAISWCRQNGWKLLFVGSGHSFSARFKVPDRVLTLVSVARDGMSTPDLKDLTVEVESGVPVEAVDDYVKHNGFRLDNLPPDYEGTIGGLICGEFGSTIRNLIQGVDIVDGRAMSLRFGGRVRKNVSGFDIAGLFAGSRGRLGWLDRVYLRLTPLQAPFVPVKKRKLQTSMPETDGIFERIKSAFDPDSVFMTDFS